ncbi:MAG: serine protease [Chloroflexi bacterium]|nr:serine protease [Chloroflexota bacterium]
MKASRPLVLCLVALSLLSGCLLRPTSPPPEVLEARFAKGLSEQMEPLNSTTEFAPEDTVYFSVKLKGNPRKGVITIRYLYQDQEITTVSLDLAQMHKEKGTLFLIGGNTFVGSTLTHERPFPPGDEYRAEVLIDGQPTGIYPFAVIAGAPVALEILGVTFARALGPNMEPIDPINEFPPQGPIYLSVELKGAPQQGTVGARYFYKQQEITSVQMDLAEWAQAHPISPQAQSVYVGFTLTPDQPFPTGTEYRAELSLNGAAAGTYAFAIAAPLTPASRPGAVSSLSEVKSAVVQIEAQGSFVHPQLGQLLNVAGRGSGFIIDPSGIAITNNHVAAGAAFLKVWVGGASEARNAKVLGVSECSDLAVIDIDGEGYPYLEWYQGPIPVGLEVYAAGFPLGDPEFTLLQGIVSKERAMGETDWASIDHSLEHTAPTNPGNSGGPLVTKEGKVVGISYANRADTNQHFAISRDEALPIIEQLRQGNDVNSIGVNGQAVNNGQGLSGIWVASVVSGSAADRAGVKAGDIILRMEGLILAIDGSMADYCDILRSHEPGDTLSIEVLRFATQEILEGQLNGRELTVKTAFERQVEEAAQGEEGRQGAPRYSGYRTVTDDTGALTVDIPNEWTDVGGGSWKIEGKVVGVGIAAARDIERFRQSWAEPGMLLGASAILAQEFDEAGILDQIDYSDECESRQRFTDYDDGLYTGQYDVYKGCGEANSTLIVLAAMPEERDFIIVLTVGLVSEADEEALKRIIDTFEVIGELPTE